MAPEGASIRFTNIFTKHMGGMHAHTDTHPHSVFFAIAHALWLCCSAGYGAILSVLNGRGAAVASDITQLQTARGDKTVQQEIKSDHTGHAMIVGMAVAMLFGYFAGRHSGKKLT